MKRDKKVSPVLIAKTAQKEFVLFHSFCSINMPVLHSLRSCGKAGLKSNTQMLICTRSELSKFYGAVKWSNRSKREKYFSSRSSLEKLADNETN